MKKLFGLLLSGVLVLGLLLPCLNVQAGEPTDKILSYDIKIILKTIWIVLAGRGSS